MTWVWQTAGETAPVVESDRDENEQRCGPRSSLFLAAMIESAGVESPVRIRDLSESGARLEGPAFPPVGARLTLRRQEVKIDAAVKWIAGPRCGIAFDGRVAVADWIAGKSSGPVFGQAQVDALQAAVRAGAPAPVQPSAPAAAFEQAGLDARLAQELASVRRLLETVSGDLIGDPAVVQRHAAALQGFDLADQILGHLTAVLTAADREQAIRAIGMEELRARLLRRARDA
jgi:hypothetical protein